MSVTDNILSSINSDFLKSETLIALWNKLTAKYFVFRDIITEAFGPEGVLILACFAVLILLLIIIYIRTVINAFSDWKEQRTVSHTETADTNTAPQQAASTDSERYDTELEKERELSQNLIQAAQISASLHDSEDYKILRQKMKRHAAQEAKRQQNLAKFLSHSHNIGTTEISAVNLKNSNLVAIILNLLERNVTEQKIAQALFFNFKDSYSENEIIQLIKAVKDFLGLCNSGRFMFLPASNKLPTFEDAVSKLALGDASGCLILLQALLNESIEEATLQSGIMKDMSYALAANYACLMGCFAKFRDPELAHDSFELATELSPKNVAAWDNLGDMFILEDATEKSMIAYQNVLDIADTDMYPSHVANAKKQMAAYYRKISLPQKAEQYQHDSAEFYAKYGITLNLTPAEDIAFKTIVANSDSNLPSAIHNLLTEHAI
ncbi:MAG: hypothetical protein ILA52_02030 [Alphaproteobacteria bacterium]|nr:hypothetical protein [Alphaproteobacteria bacterium]